MASSRTHHRFAWPFVVSLLLFAAIPAGAASPNILFIMTDQQIADGLSSRMGREYLNTPALDRLAARGTFFTRAYAPNPLCIPSLI